MLQLKNIVKTYVTGDLVQHALQGVSITFRENEFVSILGQSGSGKTTMLNIIGGLDQYTDGDLVTWYLYCFVFKVQTQKGEEGRLTKNLRT